MNLKNPFRHHKKNAICPDAPFPSIEAKRPLELLARCPDYKETPLHCRQIEPIKGHIFIKDERNRMGLGSFKALGAAYVIAHLAQKQSVADTTFVTASAGNHGLSVAAGAKIFGARSVVFLSHTVPETFSEKLQFREQRSAGKVTITKPQWQRPQKQQPTMVGFFFQIVLGQATQNYRIG